MKAFKLCLVVLASAVIFSITPPAPTHAFDFFRNSSNPVCNSGSSSSAVCKQPSNQQKNPVVDVIQVTSSVFALMAGVLAVIMIIVSGLTLTTSGGNQEAVANSRKRIVNSIIGLAIVALAWVIIRFVTDQLIK